MDFLGCRVVRRFEDRLAPRLARDGLEADFLRRAAERLLVFRLASFLDRERLVVRPFLEGLRRLGDMPCTYYGQAQLSSPNPCLDE
jgi:hypothetical protein